MKPSKILLVALIAVLPLVALASQRMMVCEEFTYPT